MAITSSFVFTPILQYLKFFVAPYHACSDLKVTELDVEKMPDTLGLPSSHSSSLPQQGIDTFTQLSAYCAQHHILDNDKERKNISLGVMNPKQRDVAHDGT
jgi:hypothetical protein|mmetsp:Transcript_6313/g.11813  ORF Transcript_6313/g.11813 Transcript_6313/m.11813 type:complete len:101 (+) Transcript_6313:359-661(+)